MDRHPGLTICLAHAGGYVPYAVDRIDKGWLARPNLRGRAQDRPSTYVDRFYYDTVTYTDRNLRFLVDVVGVERVVFGTDWPAPMVVDDPVRRIERSAALTDDERHAILWGNTASRVLRGRRFLTPRRPPEVRGLRAVSSASAQAPSRRTRVLRAGVDELDHVAVRVSHEQLTQAHWACREVVERRPLAGAAYGSSSASATASAKRGIAGVEPPSDRSPADGISVLDGHVEREVSDEPGTTRRGRGMPARNSLARPTTDLKKLLGLDRGSATVNMLTWLTLVNGSIATSRGSGERSSTARDPASGRVTSAWRPALDDYQIHLTGAIPAGAPPLA